jgi:integrase
MRTLGAHSETLTSNDTLTPEAISRATTLTTFWSAPEDDPAQHPDHGTVTWLIAEYERSDWYAGLAGSSKKQGDRALRIISSALGTAKVAHIQRRHVRAFHNRCLDEWSRHKANKLIQWLRRVLAYGVEIGLIEHNPARHMALRHNPPRRVRWTPEEVEAVKATALEAGRPEIALLVQLGYDTSQRLGDILSAKWSQIDHDGCMTFTQRKTGAEVCIP